MVRMTIILMLCLQSLTANAALPQVLKIYLDADRTGHQASALSIEMGFKTAFAEIDNRIANIPVEFVTTDHRGNALRSYKNMERFKHDPAGLAYVAGLHSPPLIKYREYLNESGLLTLVPWAAGAPVTRYPSTEKNYVFRLSVDDSKVGKVLVDHAIKEGCSNPHLVLESTGWGKSNHKAMSKALMSSDKSRAKAAVTWFDWGISDTNARMLMREVQAAGSQCILLVANAREGQLILEAINDLNLNLSVYSHWGITGGNFAKQVPHAVRDSANLQFIQSCFNFYKTELSPFQAEVFKRARQRFPAQIRDDYIQAPAGFVHGYDLAKVFIQAADQVDFNTDITLTRKALKQALESIQTPVQGLLKVYNQPFQPYSSGNPDAHEALTSDDICMAKYDKHDRIVLNLKK